MGKVPHRVMCLITWSPAGGAVWEGYVTFVRENLAGGGTSLGVGLENL